MGCCLSSAGKRYARDQLCNIPIGIRNSRGDKYCIKVMERYYNNKTRSENDKIIKTIIYNNIEKPYEWEQKTNFKN